MALQDVDLVVVGRVAERDEVAVVVDLVVEVGVRGQLAVDAEPLVPSGRDVVGIAAGGISVQVLADHGRAVALGLEPGGERRALLARIVERLEAPVRRSVEEHAVVVAIHAGEDRGARGAADRDADVGGRERDPAIADEALDPGHEREGPRVEVIGDDEDDVGGALRRGRHGRARDARGGGPTACPRGERETQDARGDDTHGRPSRGPESPLVARAAGPSRMVKTSYGWRDELDCTRGRQSNPVSKCFACANQELGLGSSARI